MEAGKYFIYVIVTTGIIVPMTGILTAFLICSEFQCSIKLKWESHSVTLGEKHVTENTEKSSDALFYFLKHIHACTWYTLNVLDLITFIYQKDDYDWAFET